MVATWQMGEDSGSDVYWNSRVKDRMRIVGGVRLLAGKSLPSGCEMGI